MDGRTRLIASLCGLALSVATARAQPVPAPVAAPASDSFVAALDQQARATAAGAARIGEPVRGYAPRTDWTASLAPGNCYVIAARGGAGVRRVSLFLWTPDGRRAGADKPRGTTSSLRYCATWLGAYHVQAKIEGAGPYLVGTYVLPSGAGKHPSSAAAVAPPLVGAPVASPAPVYAPPPPAPVYAPPPVYVAPQPIYVAPAPTVVVTPVIVPAGGRVCSSSLDCGSGQFCKENSDGIHVCMGKGGRGAACSSSIDCDFGLFCKDRGDDFTVCM